MKLTSQRRAQGSFEYIIILAVIILIALIIVAALSAFGIFEFRDRLQENANEINNLIRDVSVYYTIQEDGYTQLAVRSVLDSKVVIHNFTIGGCLFELNATDLTTSWKNFEQNCSALQGFARDDFDYTCTLTYIDARDILHKDVGRCYGIYEDA